MTDIFISYARADRPRAERLARALGAAGWSVWWDREIPPGRSFAEVIEEALSSARCVIVLWSQVSVRSEWVKTEAAEAAQRRILVPILVDGASIPLEFRHIQSAAFDRWDDPAANRDWPQLNDAIGTLIGARPVAAAPTVPPTIQRTIDRSWAATAISGVLATAVMALGAVYFVAQLFTAPVAGSAWPIEKPSIQDGAPLPAVARLALRAPAIERPASDAIFDATLLYGVFRDQAGRLSISSAGVRFGESASGHWSFEVPCGDIRKIATATMIADREQRLIEITLAGQAYRLRAADTSARDSIRGALARNCGSR